MGILVRHIPLFELVLVLAVLGLAGLGYFSGLHRPQPGAPTGKWALAGLVGVTVLAILFFLFVSLA